MKKKFWCDVDDVILDFQKQLHRDFTAQGWPTPDGYYSKGWDYKCVTGCPDAALEVILSCVHNNSDDLDTIGKPAELMEAIRRLGWEINLITAHPATLTPERLANLARHGVAFDHFYSTCHFNENGERQFWAKHELVRLLGHVNDKTVNLFADDKLSSVAAFVASGAGHGVSMDIPMNRRHLRKNPLDPKIAAKIEISPLGKNKQESVEIFHERILERAKSLTKLK